MGWLDALERAGADGGDFTADGSYLLPLDQRYYDELTIKSRAQLDQMTQAYDAARTADSVSSRITGSSIMYSAALLLLTVATTTDRKSGRFALNSAALAIMVVAIIVGWATPRFG